MLSKASNEYLDLLKSMGNTTKAKQLVIDLMKESAEAMSAGDYCPETFISSSNGKNLDLKIRVLAAVIDGNAAGNIPGYEKAYDNYPNDGRIY